jgi:hypothetical protein
MTTWIIKAIAIPTNIYMIPKVACSRLFDSLEKETGDIQLFQLRSKYAVFGHEVFVSSQKLLVYRPRDMARIRI